MAFLFYNMSVQEIINSNNQPSSDKGGGTGQTLKTFLLQQMSQKEMSDFDMGVQVAKYIDSTVNGGYQGYYWARNARFRTNRYYANGRINMSKFMDLLDFNGKINYVNLNWQCIKLGNRVISGLVGRWMGRTEKIEAQATDSISEKDKLEEFKNLEFIVSNKKMLQELEKASGVSLIPKDKPIPDDKEELNLWQSQYQRLPEEILMETGCNDVLDANGYFGILKEKMLHDSAEVGFVGTYTWMDENGLVKVRLVKPENSLYSYSEFPDFRDTEWRGEVRSLKIAEMRREFGVEYGGVLTEEELFDIAETCKEYQLIDKLTWDLGWNNAWIRPYDEWNTEITCFEVRTLETKKYTITTTKGTGSTIIDEGLPKTASGNIRQKPSDNQEVISNDNWCIYEGVYLRVKQKMLKWNIKKNMITPQDPSKISQADFSYTFYMPQNYDMRNVAVPEKIQEPLDMMILTRLKIEQCIAKMRPPGAAINVDALQEIDYGLGDANKDIDKKKLFDQTGDIYYRGKDAEGNPIPIPITELQNSGFLQQMQGLISLYQFHYQVLKDELGEDPNLMNQAAQPRVTEGNVQTSIKEAENATDYFYDAYLYCIEITANKIACLLHKSVTFGSKAYRTLMNESQISGRVFRMTAKMLPTEIEMARLDAFLNNALQANPELIMFLNPFQITRIAKEDVKMAEQFVRQAQKKMALWKQQQAEQNSQQNAQVQQQSLQMKAAFDKDQMQTEMQLKGDLQDRESRNKLLEIFLTGALAVEQKDLDLKPEWLPLQQEIIANVLMPLFAQNMQNVGTLGSAIQMQQQKLLEQQQAAQAQQQQAQPQDNGQPQPQQNQQPQPQQQAA